MFNEKVQAELTHTALLITRLWIGLVMFFAHGWPKLANWSVRRETFADPLGVGSATSLALTVFAEVFCALLIVVGFGTRLAAIPLTFAMVVAAFVVHGADPWQKKEFALLFAFVYFMLILTGPGKYSLDHFIAKRWKAKRQP
jgi:putative oxidoreductase